MSEKFFQIYITSAAKTTYNLNLIGYKFRLKLKHIAYAGGSANELIRITSNILRNPFGNTSDILFPSTSATQATEIYYDNLVFVTQGPVNNIDIQLSQATSATLAAPTGFVYAVLTFSFNDSELEQKN